MPIRVLLVLPILSRMKRVQMTYQIVNAMRVLKGLQLTTRAVRVQQEKQKQKLQTVRVLNAQQEDTRPARAQGIVTIAMIIALLM